MADATAATTHQLEDVIAATHKLHATRQLGSHFGLAHVAVQWLRAVGMGVSCLGCIDARKNLLCTREADKLWLREDAALASIMTALAGKFLAFMLSLPAPPCDEGGDDDDENEDWAKSVESAARPLRTDGGLKALLAVIGGILVEEQPDGPGHLLNQYDHHPTKLSLLGTDTVHIGEFRRERRTAADMMTKTTGVAWPTDEEIESQEFRDHQLYWLGLVAAQMGYNAWRITALWQRLGTAVCVEGNAAKIAIQVIGEPDCGKTSFATVLAAVMGGHHEIVDKRVFV
jgi:hypothetical protein